MSLVFIMLLAAGADHSSKPWAEGVTAGQRKKAEALLAEGNALFVKSKYLESLTRYDAALAIYDHPAIHFNIARARINLDQVLEAYDSIEAALRYGEAPLKGLYAEARNYQRLLGGQIATVVITCSQEEVVVTVDGGAVLLCPGEESVRTRPGKHQVVARREGFVTLTQEIVALPGQTQPVALRLQSVQEATVTVRRWDVWKPWGIIGGGLGVSGLGALLVAKGRRNREDYGRQLSNDCSLTPCSDNRALNDLWRKAERQNGVGIGALVMGGAVVLTGAILAVLNQPKPALLEDNPSTDVIPMISSGSVGAMVQRRF